MSVIEAQWWNPIKVRVWWWASAITKVLRGRSRLSGIALGTEQLSNDARYEMFIITGNDPDAKETASSTIRGHVATKKYYGSESFNLNDQVENVFKSIKHKYPCFDEPCRMMMFGEGEMNAYYSTVLTTR